MLQRQKEDLRGWGHGNLVVGRGQLILVLNAKLRILNFTCWKLLEFPTLLEIKGFKQGSDLFRFSHHPHFKCLNATSG